MSKALEFQFNPHSKKTETRVGTFCFFPETRKERKSGFLYCLGELKDSSAQNQELLFTLAEIIKKGNYKNYDTPATDSFQQALNKANEFLAKELQKNNLSWLGNLNFAVISLNSNCWLKVTKVGSLKIILVRETEAFDIGVKLNCLTSGERLFADVIEGELNQGDRLLVLTEEIFHIFQDEKILEDLTKTKTPKLVRQIFKEKKKILRELSGAGILVFVKKKRLFLTLPNIIALNYGINPHTKIFGVGVKQKKFLKTLMLLILLAIILILGYFFL